MYWTTAPVFATAIIAGFPSGVHGHPSRWARSEAGTTMCDWPGLRAAQLKDTAYLDGGRIRRVDNLPGGGIGSPEEDTSPLIYKLNFRNPFDSSTDISRLLSPISSDGEAANKMGPKYNDGAMLANDHRFVLYGGLLRETANYALPDDDEVWGYRASDYGLMKENPNLGVWRGRLPDDMTRYVTYGGAANAPSENKAWYFGGYRSPTGGPIFNIGANKSTNPSNVSDTFITLDLSESQSETWTNVSLSDVNVESRANPSVVWVPVGEQGILVVLGGVLYPNYNTISQASSNLTESERVSPGFMRNIDIYDVAGKTWYRQQTQGPPPQSARGCAVVAVANDSSSYNVYYYGGFDGLHSKKDYSDEVWVLSMPSFTWTKISDGEPGKGRIGHQCLTPYPDQMIVIGGERSSRGGGSNPCLDSILRVFNLTDGTWLSSYDPSVYNTYGVPRDVHVKIGGSYTGGATMTTPAPSGWDTPSLADVFATTYDTSKITSYFPYPSEDIGGGEGGQVKSEKKNGTPSWVAPVLGVVLGLIFVTAIVVGILLFRRRRLLKEPSRSGTPGYEHHHYIRKWLNGMNGEKVPTEEPSSRYDELDSRNDTPMRPVGYAAGSPFPGAGQYETQHEMPENQRYELPNTSTLAELDGEALSHVDVLTKHTQLHSPTSPHSRSPHSILQSPSPFTGSVSQEQPSSLSSSQVGASAASLARERPDSPSLGSAGPARAGVPNRGGIVSDLSRISEHHMSHLRNLSAGTVSSTSNTAPSLPSTPPAAQSVFGNGPVSPPLPSPPTGGDEHSGAGDYLSAYGSPSLTGFLHDNNNNNTHAGLSRGQGASGSLRLSVFRENSEDLGDSPSKTHHTR